MASTILNHARQVLIEFLDTARFMTDAELLPLLSAEILALLDHTLLLGNPAFPLPGDTYASVDVAALNADGYTIHADFWRARRLEVRYASARRVRGFLVPEEASYAVPDRIPAAFILGGKLLAVDGQPALVANRVHGWANAATARVLWLAKPADLATAGDTVKSPDEARTLLAYRLARAMAVRAKPAAAIIDAITKAGDMEQQKYDALVVRYGRGEG